MTQWIVFTDLDGTLLSPNGDIPESVRYTMAKLASAGVLIVFCSSKPHAEQSAIRNDLGLETPYIVEFGSALIMSDGTRRVFGIDATVIHQYLERIRFETGLRFQTFKDVSSEEIATATGWSLATARLARQADYSATLITQLDDDMLQRFKAACAVHHLRLPATTDHIAVTGNLADSGRAVGILTEYYRSWYGDNIRTIGIGTRIEAAPMLATVNEPYLIKNADGRWAGVDVVGLQKVDDIGPDGWVKLMDGIFKNL